MKWPGTGEQMRHDPYYDLSGTIASATLPQLILPVSLSRSFLFVQNISTAPMYLQKGSATATATLTNGTVTSCSITNAGFNFTKPPVVRFLGGGPGPGLVAKGQPVAGGPFLGGNLPGYPSPSNFAQGLCHLTAGALSSIEITNPGSGYLIAPYVFIFNSDLDPYGCADPSLNSGNGLLLGANGGSFYVNGTTCATDSLALFCATLGSKFTLWWMT